MSAVVRYDKVETTHRMHIEEDCERLDVDRYRMVIVIGGDGTVGKTFCTAFLELLLLPFQMRLSMVYLGIQIHELGSCLWGSCLAALLMLWLKSAALRTPSRHRFTLQKDRIDHLT